ncbi:MAG: type VII secretion protein EssC [Bacteroidales bacterium]|nr:type VII secretion protein EssC [Clostridium sp.]MCM1204255.1 type VII secretion protein EssC [Bacteroidales bacterium]
MVTVLSVFTNSAFKEIRLPNLVNTDYSFILYKKIFDLSEDFEIELENINGNWCFVENTKYVVMKNTEKYEGKTIQNQDILHVFTEKSENITIIVQHQKYSISVFDKYDISQINEITIGKNEDMDICFDFEGLVSRYHARLYRVNDNQWMLENKSVNGIYVNSVFIQENTVLNFGDFISFTNLQIMFLGKCIAINQANTKVMVNKEKLAPICYETFIEEQESILNTGVNDEKFQKDGMVLLRRSPRNIEKIDTEPVQIEAPPDLGRVKKQSIFLTIGPSFTMVLPMLLGSLLMVYSSQASGGSSGLYMYSGLIMSVASAVIGVVWAVVNLYVQNKSEKEDALHRFEAYSNYLVKRTELIKEKYERNIQAMNLMYQSADVCADYDEHSSVLWNRNFRHHDFMFYRLGLGNIPFQVQIDVPREQFKLYEDSLAEKPKFIKENYKTLYNVPVGIDLLKNRLVGLIGGENLEGAENIVKLLASQIAANNCYTDVKMVFVYDDKDSSNLDKWEYVKWFPHVWSEDKKLRFIASNKQEAGDVFYNMAKIFRQREELGETKKKEVIQKPYFIMFLINPEMIEGELIAKYVFDTNANYGLSTVIVADSYTKLPNECEYIVENDSNFQGVYDVKDSMEERLQIQFDNITDGKIGQFAKRLSNIYVRETESGGDIPSAVTFFEMYGVNRLQDLNVLDRWRKNRTYDNIRGMTGVKAGGNPSYLDVHEKYHGPHGLVAGTTGSGKSETLQTYMLSLAVNYSPDDIGFFIIDYKGGGMANLFNGLPHMIGQISNLSGNQVHRAMVSIKSENRRRQRIFSENGVNNINLYTKLYKNNEVSVPVPHLFIIIDEFAELKREEPDFMKELVSVAQVGRSLGVHLILATQKPSGTVDDNIWSNSKFRLCLRVQDRQDSNDMLHKPDAAYITQAGRCYLQVGNDEVFELFQSGFSGAVYSEDEEDTKTEIAKLITLDGKVDMTGNYAKASQKEKVLVEWLTTIERYLHEALEKEGTTLGDCRKTKARLQAVIDDLYQMFEENMIDYPISAYNTARLEDYLELYASLEKEDGIIQKMIERAEQNNIKLPQAKDKTQLDAVKEYLAKVAKENGYTHELQLWMPVLPTAIYLNAFDYFNKNCYRDGQWPEPEGEWNIEVVLGLYDDPQNQAQVPININFTEGGHHAVCGMVVSGKSTSLQTVVYGLVNKYTPEYINIYAIDFSSKMMTAFEKAPHVGGVMYEGDYEKISKFFNMLQTILEERKVLFRGGNYSQYVQVNGVKLPMILVIIDNVSAFIEKTEEEYIDFLIMLSKEGVSHGIYLLLTGAGFGTTEIPSRVAENIKTTICTEMADKFAYSDVMHTVAIDVIPETNIKGRGLAYYGNRILEYQTALACQAEDDYQRIEKISALCRDMRENWKGKKARPIPEIPEKPVWSEFSELEEYEKVLASPRYLPVAYNAEDASVYGLDLEMTYCYLVTGLPRSGKKNFMKIMIQSALLKKSRIYILDSDKKHMRAFEEREEVCYANDERGIYDFFSSVIPEFKKRNEIKKAMVEEDAEESEIFERLSTEQPIFFFIPDLEWFINLIYNAELEMKGFIENILEKGRLLNFYFIGVIGLEAVSMVDYQKAFELFAGYKTGVHFGGNVAENHIYNFDAIPYKEQSKLFKPGIGMIANRLNDEVEQIIVPSARR